MLLELIRLEQIGEATIGELRVDGRWHSWTLEDRVRAARNHPETAIPAGSYDIRLTRSRRFKDVTPEVMNVPEFPGIRIHGGGSNMDLTSSILLGLNRNGAQFSDTHKAYNSLMYRFAEVPKGGSVTLKITQPADWPRWGERVMIDAPRPSYSASLESAPRWNLDDLQWRPEPVVEPIPPGAILDSHPADGLTATVDSDRAWRLTLITWILAISTGGYAWIANDYRLLYLVSGIASLITLCWFARSAILGRR